MTRRRTYLLTQTLQRLDGYLPSLRYVADAGAVPQSYFKDGLAKMRHPRTDESLSWSRGVDFYHAYQYQWKKSSEKARYEALPRQVRYSFRNRLARPMRSPYQECHPDNAVTEVGSSGISDF